MAKLTIGGLLAAVTLTLSDSQASTRPRRMCTLATVAFPPQRDGYVLRHTSDRTPASHHRYREAAEEAVKAHREVAQVEPWRLRRAIL
jgi:hypothetical protein